MNNQLIILAKAIQIRILQLQESNFEAIDKDILLEDIRNLYRLAQQIELQTASVTVEPLPIPTAAVSNPVVTETIIPNTTTAEKEKEAEKEQFNFAIGMQEDTSPSAELNEVPLEELVASIQNELREAQQKREAAQKEKEALEALVNEVRQENAFNFNLNMQDNDAATAQRHEETLGIGGNTAPSLNEAFAKEEISLNETISSSPVKELHNLISSKTSFSSLLDFNNRILFTRELFNGNSELCNAFMAQLERCTSLEEAKSLVNTNALSKGWRGDNEAVKVLVGLVRQFFAS